MSGNFNLRLFVKNIALFDKYEEISLKSLNGMEIV